MIDSKDINAAAQRLDGAREFLHIAEKTAQLEALDAKIAEPGFWDKPDAAAEVSRQAGSIRATIADFNAASALLDDCRTAYELASDDPAFEEDAESAYKRLRAMLDQFEVESWFSGEFDEGDCIININPGSGGLEAQDWTDMLYRMYTRYCDSKGWKLRLLDYVFLCNTHSVQL